MTINYTLYSKINAEKYNNIIAFWKLFFNLDANGFG